MPTDAEREQVWERDVEPVFRRGQTMPAGMSVGPWRVKTETVKLGGGDPEIESMLERERARFEAFPEPVKAALREQITADTRALFYGDEA